MDSYLKPVQIIMDTPSMGIYHELEMAIKMTNEMIRKRANTPIVLEADKITQEEYESWAKQFMSSILIKLSTNLKVVEIK